MPPDNTPPTDEELKKRNEQLEEKVDRLQKLVEALKRQLRNFLKVYPQIIQPTSGGNPIPRNAALLVQVNSNSRANGTHEVVIVIEGDLLTLLAGGPQAVTFAGGNNPGTAQFPPAAMMMLQSDTDYLLICRKAGGASDPNFVVHQIAIHTQA